MNRPMLFAPAGIAGPLVLALRIAGAFVCCLLAACSPGDSPGTPASPTGVDPSASPVTESAPADTITGNPLLEPWDTLHGIPPFERIRNEHYRPAFEAGIQALREQIAAIRRNPEPPDFANTVEALEMAGGALERVAKVFNNITNTDTNPELDALEVDMSPRLSREFDAIVLDEALFARLQAVYEQRSTLDLDVDEARLLELKHRDFRRSGAALAPEAKERLAGINARIAELTTIFAQNLLRETKAFTLLITDPADLSGLSAASIGAARSAAQARGHAQGWLFGLDRSVYEDFMTFADNRELRRQMFEAYRNRASLGGSSDNREVLGEIARLRAERATLLGYTNHAAYQLETRMAQTPERAEAFLLEVWKPGLARAEAERAEMQELIAAEGHGFILEGWDWWYYAEKLRRLKYSLDEGEVKPYFELNNVREGAFYVAHRLFGLRFVPLPDAPAWNPVVQSWEVFDAEGGFLGVFMADYYARASKRGGAWKSNYRDASAVGGQSVRPIVTNNMNLTIPAEGEPTLLSFSEVETLFHEFGHALHALMTEVRYPSFSGTSGSPRDFTEFPAQFLEHYAAQPDVLAVYARHYASGAPVPVETVEKLRAARRHNQGFETTEFIAAALLDLRWHSLDPAAAAAVEDAAAFEQATLENYGLPAEIGPRYRSPYFAHIFAGGYSAGYYAYLWSEILDSDGFTAFEETGDIFNSELAQRLRENVYEAGGRADAAELYRRFRGQDPGIEALLRLRGLDIPAPTDD